jgi:hypothetical protein
MFAPNVPMLTSNFSTLPAEVMLPCINHHRLRLCALRNERLLIPFFGIDHYIVMVQVYTSRRRIEEKEGKKKTKKIEKEY